MSTIIFDIEDITVGREFMWNETGNLTFIIVAVHADPQVSFAGHRIQPFADVVWSDGGGHVTTMTIREILAGYRSGQII